MGASHPVNGGFIQASAGRGVLHRVLVASSNASHAQWLQAQIGQTVTVEHCLASTDAIAAKLGQAISVVVVMFDTQDDLSQPSHLVQWLLQYKAEVPVLGMGFANATGVALSALRAGVKDFLDMASDNPVEVKKHVLEACMRGGSAPRTEQPQGKIIVLLGARSGMGVTTLSVHLAAALATLQERAPSKAASGAEALGIGLLDLGFPLRDGQMLMGLNGAFHMVDAVKGANRLDKAMLEAVLPQHGSGVHVLSWPAQPQMLRNVSPELTVSVMRALRAYFAWQVVDVGGFLSQEIVHEVIQAADEVWLVSDQSLGGIVSSSEWLKSLRSSQELRVPNGLVVNRAYRSQGLPPEDIAKRLALPLRYTLPHREEALLKASCSGYLLSESMPSDPYVREVKAIAQHLRAMTLEKNVSASAKSYLGLGSWLKRGAHSEGVL